MLNLIIFGPPGSGKGTQSIKIAEKYGLGHISTGEIFRAAISNSTNLGKQVQQYLDKGELVPDELLIEILENAVNKFSNVNGFIFDGFPRTLRQARDLDIMLTGRDDAVTAVLALEVEDDEIISRLLKRARLEGRKDDTEEVIKNRLHIYQTQTSPLIQYYKEQGKLRSFHGVGTIEDIFGNLCIEIDNFK